jgi:hypothetical protein
MTLSPAGLVGAIIFLAFGVVELVIFMRAVYPVLSSRHEVQKVTYSHGRSPALITTLVRLQSLVLMPVIGYMVGSQFMFWGAN